MTEETIAPLGAPAAQPPSGPLPPLAAPGRSGGLLEVSRRRYLLRLVVRRELKARYHGSILGLGWSYARPLVNFGVYYFAVGIFLGLSKRTHNLPIFLFAALVVLAFFTETLINSTHSIVGNRELVQKIYLPREMFPVASMLVSAVHLIPGMIILIPAACIAGWTPSVLSLISFLLGLAIVTTFGLGLGMIFAAYNVYYRDISQIVDILMILVTWSVPMIYPWTDVKAATGGGWPLQVYLYDPIATAVILFQRAFWWPTTNTADYPMPGHLTERALFVLAACIALVALAQFVFTRKQRRFAQEL